MIYLIQFFNQTTTVVGEAEQELMIYLIQFFNQTTTMGYVYLYLYILQAFF